MNKILAAALSVVSLVGLGACSSSHKTDPMSNYCASVQTINTDLDNYIQSGNYNVNKLYNDGEQLGRSAVGVGGKVLNDTENFARVSGHGDVQADLQAIHTMNLDCTTTGHPIHSQIDPNA